MKSNIAYNNRMKLCGQMIHNKRQFKEKKILLSRQQYWPQIPFKDFIICILFASVDEKN